MSSALASPPPRTLATAVATLLCCCCCWLELADADLTTLMSTDGGNNKTNVGANSSATPPHMTTSTSVTGHSECPILQENSGDSGDERCRWSSTFYVIVVLSSVVIVLAVVIPTALLCLRRRRNSQGQDNVEAKVADDKPQERRKKNDYTGPPVPTIKVQHDPNDIDYSLVPDDGDHFYGNDERIYVNATFGREPLEAAAGNSGDCGDERRGGATVAGGSSNDADEIEYLPPAPLPPAACDVSKSRVRRAGDSGGKAARGPKAGAAVAAVGRAPRQRAAGGSAGPSTREVEADTAGSAPRRHATDDGGGPSKPLKAEAAATGARTPIAEKLARAVAAKRQEIETEKQAHGQEIENDYENFRR